MFKVNSACILNGKIKALTCIITFLKGINSALWATVLGNVNIKGNILHYCDSLKKVVYVHVAEADVLLSDIFHQSR